ncbi:MAG: amidase [Gammaproteobacteria bacterium]|jgi:amidase
MSESPCLMSATALASAIAKRDLGVREVMQAFLQRIEQLNPAVNAIVTLCPEQALECADVLDSVAPNGARGPLFGLPIAIKDLVPTAGIRTTFGSPIYADFVPDFDELFVTRLKAAGGIIIGKTNTPEFGAGSQTFNQVFGATRNPYNLARTCGGSSGGAAVALRCAMLPLADGSDLGGSLRNPASFCNVVGLRPSPGRVPSWPKQFSSDQFAVHGPMARTVEDVALLLSVMAGPDLRVPIALPESGQLFNQAFASELPGGRFAWSPDLGHGPVDPVVTSVLEQFLPVIDALGGTVELDQPDLHDAGAIFNTFRAWAFVERFRDDYAKHRDRMKDTVRWNIEEGSKLSLADLSAATINHSALVARVATFFDRYDFLVCPAAAVPPFAIEQEWVTSINGQQLPTYLDWMAVCWAITVTGCPAISIPAGFTPDGLPIGIQIVAPRGRDRELLEVAYVLEQATQHGLRQPDMLVSHS